MTETALDQFWQLLWGGLSLNPQQFYNINVLPQGTTVALAIVLIAGLSQAMGQSIVLFINTVKPLRFIFSLAVFAILFVFTYGFWVLTIWLVSNLFFNVELSLLTAARTLALSYAPQTLGFLIVLPYFGLPLSALLSIWSLLAGVYGLQVVAGFDSWSAFACAGLGWVVLELLERTLGRPIAVLGQRLLNLAAGTKLITDWKQLKQVVMAGKDTTIDYVSNNLLAEAGRATRKHLKGKGAIALIALGVITFALVIILSPPSQSGIALFYNALAKTVRIAVDLTLIALVAFIVSILLTPFEALSWWAGWSEDIPLEYPGTRVEDPKGDINPPSRYVVYLDGINQGSYKYLPEANRLLDALAEATPSDVLIVKGIMPYSVDNQPLSENRPLSFFWRVIDSIVLKNPTHPISAIVKIRNVIAVTVAADPRYGPIQNQALAQVLFESLLHFGYRVSNQTPITLIGYSGGGQMSLGAAAFLKRATRAPIDVISLSGVISGNGGTMEVERIYHLVGEKDVVEKLGPIMFPGRWAIAILSKWNRAKRRGKINFISLGDVAHNDIKGPMGETKLPDGRTRLEQTVELMNSILVGDWEGAGLDPNDLGTFSNYELFKAALFNQYSYYPLQQKINEELYQPIAPWMGRLILPAKEQRDWVGGVFLEIHHADEANQHRVGQVVNLRWKDSERVQTYVKLVTKDVNFVEQVRVSKQKGNIHPDRLDGWEKVDPLESLAGARPLDDVIVKLDGPIEVEDHGDDRPSIYITREPVQITGRYYALVTFESKSQKPGFLKKPGFLEGKEKPGFSEPKPGFLEGEDFYLVRHYNRESQKFDGAEETVYIPSVIADRNGVYPSSNRDLEKSPVNSSGWYVYGAKNREGYFVVQAIAPRTLFSVVPQKVISGEKATVDYINFKYWQNIKAQKGKVKTVLLQPHPPQETEWKEGDRALLMHVYGGMGGEDAEFAPLGLFFGHFAYGVAEVVRDPLSEELRFEIEYQQIYTHNTDGIISGRNGWSRFMGDRQFGWLGIRPIADIAIKFEPLTREYNFDGNKISPLDEILYELDIMAARYRIGDGTGTTFVTPVNSCIQDSNQAVYWALERAIANYTIDRLMIKWLREHPKDEQTQSFLMLASWVKSLEKELTPMGVVRSDWEYNAPTLGSFAVETPVQTLARTAASWPSLFPRLAADRITMIFLQLGAEVLVMRATQVGGADEAIEPIAPTDFGWRVPPVEKPKLL
jgi:predicted Abi (CAAX) family protease